MDSTLTRSALHITRGGGGEAGREREPLQGVAASWGATRCVGAKKICEIGVGFSFAALSVFRLRRAEAASAVWIPHSLGAFRIARDAGGEAVDVNGNLVERGKGD